MWNNIYNYSEHMSNICRKHNIKELQKTAILDTAETNVKVYNVNHGK